MEAPAGWYPDPQAEADERYWDGSEWTERTRQAVEVPKVGASGEPSSAFSARAASGSGDAAVLASMGYLHAIALVVISGVVVGFGVAIGTLFLFAFEAAEVAGVFYFVGGAVGIAMLIGSVVALVRADSDRAKARSRS